MLEFLSIWDERAGLLSDFPNERDNFKLDDYQICQNMQGDV